MEHTKIILKASEFFRYVEELKEELDIEAVEVSIYEIENIETGILERRLSIDIVESGGWGLVSNDDDLTEMTRDEILDIGSKYDNTPMSKLLDAIINQIDKDKLYN